MLRKPISTNAGSRPSAELEKIDALWRAANRAKASPDWRYRELATTHMVPSNCPDELTDLLLELKV